MNSNFFDSMNNKSEYFVDLNKPVISGSSNRNISFEYYTMSLVLGAVTAMQGSPCNLTAILFVYCELGSNYTSDIMSVFFFFFLPLHSAIPEYNSKRFVLYGGLSALIFLQWCYGLYIILEQCLHFFPTHCSAIKPEKIFNYQALPQP